MKSDDLLTLVDLYSQYRSVLTSLPRDGDLVTYGWGNLPPSLHMSWMAYGQMFDEFSREIANSINELVNHAHRLKAWSVVMSTLPRQQILEVLIEFVEPLATVALNLPYVIQSRFIFATAHLAHQANRAVKGGSWKDDLPLDRKIVFKIADRYGAPWKSYVGLKACLERISAEDYQKATGDFRHRYNHRISPRIALGLTGMVTRSIDPQTRLVRYGFGETPPLSMDQIVVLLGAQCTHCYQAFEAFKVMIGEQETHIRNTPSR